MTNNPKLDWAIQQHVEQIRQINESVDSGLELASFSRQKVGKSKDQLCDEAQQLIETATGIGWRGRLYLQLHLGKLSLSQAPIHTASSLDSYNRNSFIRSSSVWDISAPEGQVYNYETIDRLEGYEPDFEPHMRLAIYNEESHSFAHFQSLPVIDSLSSGGMVDALSEVKNELSAVGSRLQVTTLNLMGILALATQGVFHDEYYYFGEILAPVMAETAETNKAGVVELHRGKVNLDEVDAEASLEELGMGLSVGLTD